MPVSNENAAANDFFVERTVRIGLDALSPEERQIIEDATRTKARFLALIADPKNVEKLRPTAPYYSLKITPELRLIYTREGDRIDVLDRISPQEQEARQLEASTTALVRAQYDFVRQLFV